MYGIREGAFTYASLSVVTARAAMQQKVGDCLPLWGLRCHVELIALLEKAGKAYRW